MAGNCGDDQEVMIDVFAKKISSTKRQVLYLFYILHRYLKLREGHPNGPGKVLYIVSGRAPHSNLEGKKVIEAIYTVIKLVNEDPATQSHMKLIFVPNFNVALCEQFVAAADLS